MLVPTQTAKDELYEMSGAPNERVPVLVGVGRFTQRQVDPAVALSPLELMAEASMRAVEDAGTEAGAKAVSDFGLCIWNVRGVG